MKDHHQNNYVHIVLLSRGTLSITMCAAYIPECSISLHGVPLMSSCLQSLPMHTISCSHNVHVYVDAKVYYSKSVQLPYMVSVPTIWIDSE